MRTLALVTTAATLLSAPGCLMQRSTKSTVTVAGALATATGVVMVAAGPRAVDSDGDGANEWSLNDDYSMPMLGSLLVVGGLGMLLGGATARTLPEQPLTALVLSPPPQDRARLAPSVKAPLPEVAVDAETLRLAKQTRLVVMAGHCQPAKELLVRISARAPAYHVALVTSPVLDPCPQLR